MTFCRLTWGDFDAAVAVMAEMLRGVDPAASALRGIPRGGLPLAVALSHRTGIPLEGAGSAPGTLVIIDDVVQTGKTLHEQGARASMFLCWVRKNPSVLVSGCVVDLGPDTWVVFPWEDPSRAVVDAGDFYKRRGM